jgi:hypothetical protein
MQQQDKFKVYGRNLILIGRLKIKRGKPDLFPGMVFSLSACRNVSKNRVIFGQKDESPISKSNII